MNEVISNRMPMMTNLDVMLTVGSISARRKLRYGGRRIREEYIQSTTSRKLLRHLEVRQTNS